MRQIQMVIFKMFVMSLMSCHVTGQITYGGAGVLLRPQTNIHADYPGVLLRAQTRAEMALISVASLLTAPPSVARLVPYIY